MATFSSLMEKYGANALALAHQQITRVKPVLAPLACNSDRRNPT